MTCQIFNEVAPVLNLKYYTKSYSYVVIDALNVWCPYSYFIIW